MEVGKIKVMVEHGNGVLLITVDQTGDVPQYVSDIAAGYVTGLRDAIERHGDKLIGVAEEYA